MEYEHLIQNQEHLTMLYMTEHSDETIHRIKHDNLSFVKGINILTDYTIERKEENSICSMARVALFAQIKELNILVFKKALINSKLEILPVIVLFKNNKTSCL